MVSPACQSEKDLQARGKPDTVRAMNETLRQWRFNLGLSIEKAAEIAGVSTTQWFNWEARGVVPFPRNAKRVADIIGKAPSEIWPTAVDV